MFEREASAAKYNNLTVLQCSISAGNYCNKCWEIKEQESSTV